MRFVDFFGDCEVRVRVCTNDDLLSVRNVSWMNWGGMRLIL